MSRYNEIFSDNKKTVDSWEIAGDKIIYLSVFAIKILTGTFLIAYFFACANNQTWDYLPDNMKVACYDYAVSVFSKSIADELAKSQLYFNIYTATIIFSIIIYGFRKVLTNFIQENNINEERSFLKQCLHGVLGFFIVLFLLFLYWLVTDKVFHYHYFLMYDSIYDNLVAFRIVIRENCYAFASACGYNSWINEGKYLISAFIGCLTIIIGYWLVLQTRFSVFNYDILFVGMFFIIFSMHSMNLLIFCCTLIAGILCFLGLTIMVAGGATKNKKESQKESQKESIKNPMEFGCVCTTIGAFFSYLPQYVQMFYKDGSVLDVINVLLANLINIVQIITVNSNNYEILQKSVGNENLNICILFIRGYCHIVLPITYAYLAFGFVLQGFNEFAWKMKRMGDKEIHLFSEINKMSVVKAKSLGRQEKTLVVMFYEDKVPEKYRDLKVCFLPKYKFYDGIPIKVTNQICDRKDYTGSLDSKLHYYCISENAERNISDCIKLMDVYGYHDYSNRLSIDVYCDHKKIAEDLCDAKKEILKAKLKNEYEECKESLNFSYLDKISINFESRFRLALSNLLCNDQFTAKLAKIDKEKCCDCVLIGFDKIGDEIIEGLIGELKSKISELHVNIIVEDIQHFEKHLHIRHPQLFKDDKLEDFIKIIQTNLEGYGVIDTLNDIQKRPDGTIDFIDFIIVCRGDDEKNLETAYYVGEYFEQKQDPPYIAMYLHSESLTDVAQELENKGIDNKLGYHPFSSFERTGKI